MFMIVPCGMSMPSLFFPTRTGAGGPCRRPPQKHAQRLGERDVANVSQWRDHQPLLDAQVLVTVGKADVGDGDGHLALLLAPVAATLLEPLEITRIPDLHRRVF